MCGDSKLSTLVKKRPISLFTKTTLSTELVVHVVLAETLSDRQYLEISQHCFFYASISLLFQIRVLYSEVGLEAPSSASLPRKSAKKPGTKHRKSRSMESFDCISNNLGDNEDDFSDTDNEEEWQKEAQQGNQKDWQKETHQSNATEWQNEAQQSTYV